MTQSPAPKGTTGYRVSQAWLIVTLERFLAAFWRPLSLLVFFLALAFTGLLPHLGGILHSLVLLGLLAGFILLWYRDGRAFRLPSRGDALRRLELENDLPHRPLREAEDKLPKDLATPEAEALWRLHLKRQAERLKNLGPAHRRPMLAARDPLALRLCALFLIVMAAGVAGRDIPYNLRDSLTPRFAPGVDLAQVAVDAWVVPPSYTGHPPVFLPSGPAARAQEGEQGSGPVAVPKGSTLVVQVSGASEDLRLGDLQAEDEQLALTPVGGSAALRGEVLLEEDRHLALQMDGTTLGDWRFAVLEDGQPRIQFTEAPEETPRKALSIRYRAFDDYGVADIRLRMIRPDPNTGGAMSDAEVFEYPVRMPQRGGTFMEGAFLKDLTPHPWAGSQVILFLVARDTAGNEAGSQAAPIILPQREFTHPVAREIIKLRLKLALNADKERQNVSLGLLQLAQRPANFGDDVLVFLALSTAEKRLCNIWRDHEGNLNCDPGAGQLDDQVIKLMWDTAIRLEGGDLSLAEARLRAAEEALLDALARGAGAEELERLMDQLKSAMNDYLAEMTKDMMRRQAQGEEQPMMDPNMQEVTSQDLNAMLDQIRELMRMGMKDAASELLAQMQRMMENMQAGAMQSMSQQGAQAMEMLQDLQQMMKSQRELLDRTYQRMRNGQEMSGQPNGQSGQSQQQPRPGQSSQQAGGLSDTELQQQLQQQLNELMQRYGEAIGEVPGALPRAGDAMGRSAKALERGRNARATREQGDALDQMHSAAQDIRRQIMERFAGEGALGQQLRGENGEGGRDPLGRDAGNSSRNSPEGQVTIPGAGDIQRARQIRDELRRRSGQRDRDPVELDYIDRLLQPF